MKQQRKTKNLKKAWICLCAFIHCAIAGSVLRPFSCCNCREVFFLEVCKKWKIVFEVLKCVFLEILFLRLSFMETFFLKILFWNYSSWEFQFFKKKFSKRTFSNEISRQSIFKFYEEFFIFHRFPRWTLLDNCNKKTAANRCSQMRNGKFMPFLMFVFFYHKMSFFIIKCFF